MELQQKHVNLNEQLGKVFKENADMITLLKEKEQLIRKFEADLSSINHKHDQVVREKLDALDRIRNLEQVVDKVIKPFKKNDISNHKFFYFKELGKNKRIIRKAAKNGYREVKARDSCKRCKLISFRKCLYKKKLFKDRDLNN